MASAVTRNEPSAIEALFWFAVQQLDPPHLQGLVMQYEVFDGAYVLDFALPDHRLGIELDGYQWHGNRQSFINDKRRDRNLSLNRWVVIHFAGQEMMQSPVQCVREANAWAGAWIRERGRRPWTST